MKFLRSLFPNSKGNETPWDGYFPPNPPADLKAINKLMRDTAERDEARLKAAAAMSRSGPQFLPFNYTIEDSVVRFEQDGREFCLPRPIPRVKFTLLISGYVRWLERKYSLPGFCVVEDGDSVVDCGGFIGGFGLGADGRAASVDYFEPDATNLACLQQNIAGLSGHRAHGAGLYNRSGQIQLNRSESSVEHSFLTPDDGEAVDTIDVPIHRLDAIAPTHGLERIDFLKIEAEGVEIEVFEGVGDFPVRKIAVDVSPERDGQSPREHFETTLAEKGFEVRVRSNVLFARKP